jgi:beta-mannosidase
MTRSKRHAWMILWSATLMAGDAMAAQPVDLSGTWLMKDYTLGMGTARKLQLLKKAPADFLPVQVPGTVRSALLNAGAIPDPYVGYDNEKSLWVEEKEWWFFRNFRVDQDLKGQYIDLQFEGSSFQGEVWVNGVRAGELKGMLNPRAFDVTRILHYGDENTIVVRLEATPDARFSENARGLTWRSARDQLYSIAQSMYGWDWGPHGVPVGLWMPVKLRVTGPLRLDRPVIATRIPSRDEAVCEVAMDVRNLSDQARKAAVHGAIVEKDTGRVAAEFRQDYDLAPRDARTVHFQVLVKNPKLWWPNGMGKQDLYLMRATVSDDRAGSESLSAQFGIRELKLVANDRIDEFLKTMKEQVGDSHHLGNVVGSYPWTFQVNGKKMFAKGGNWIPADQLLRLDRDRYVRLLSLARDSNYNLLRVWGGGLYETDDFYDLCDQYGILAWQEFLSNRSFSKIDRENFLEGAESAVVRLRNHPSLTFWCGGNEFDPDDQGSKAVIDALGELLRKLDPGREFHRASPYMGDDHYWGVWHHMEPYTAYRRVRPFRSEAGLNAPPVLEDYLKFTPADRRWPLDETYIEYHGESQTRFQHLQKLLRYAGEFGDAPNLGTFIRNSQLYQALGNAFDMEFCRSNKFRNSGFLVWQFNDIWPAVSWSTVDWYGTPKPAYYYQKRASRPIHISADFERYLWKPGETFAADVYLLNDADAPVSNAVYTARLFNLEGNVLAEQKGKADGGANQSVKVGRIEYRIPEQLPGRMFFISVELKQADGNKISDALYPIAASEDLKNFQNIFAGLDRMPAAAAKAEVPGSGLKLDSNGKGSFTVRLSNPTQQLAFFVRLRMLEESQALRTSYSDNYISLLPGESKSLLVRVESREAAPKSLHFEVSGWNCPTGKLEMNTGR